MYKTKTNQEGQIELWWEGETAKSLLGVFDSQEELDKAREQVRKQEERGQFLTHTYKKGKRHHDVVKGPDDERS